MARVHRMGGALLDIRCRNPVGRETYGRIRPSHVERLEQRNRELEIQIEQVSHKVERVRPALNRHRPHHPQTARPFDILHRAQTYEEAVDRLAEMNQWLREKQAWLTMATLAAREDLPAPTRGDVILDANDRYLGVWINGAEEADALWFLTCAALLCFVIHVLPERDALRQSALDSFVKNTDVARLLDHESYEFDRIALREYRYTITDQNPVPYARVNWSAENSRRSSLRWQLNLSEDEILPLDVPPNSDEIERRCVARAHVFLGSSAPLASTSIPNLTAGTTTRPLDASEATTSAVYIRQLGQHSDARRLDKGDVEWYDRALQRRLIFEGNPDLPANSGLTTERAFGRPVPGWPFLFPSGNPYLKRSSSEWMYKDMDPRPSDVGKTAAPLRPEQLPLLPSGDHEPNKGRWVLDLDREEVGDAVSLGSSEGELSRAPDVPPVPPSPKTEGSLQRSTNRPGYIARPVPQGLSMRSKPPPAVAAAPPVPPSLRTGSPFAAPDRSSQGQTNRNIASSWGVRGGANAVPLGVGRPLHSVTRTPASTAPASHWAAPSANARQQPPNPMNETRFEPSLRNSQPLNRSWDRSRSARRGAPLYRGRPRSQSSSPPLMRRRRLRPRQASRSPRGRRSPVSLRQRSITPVSPRPRCWSRSPLRSRSPRHSLSRARQRSPPRSARRSRSIRRSSYVEQKGKGRARRHSRGSSPSTDSLYSSSGRSRSTRSMRSPVTPPRTDETPLPLLSCLEPGDSSGLSSLAMLPSSSLLPVRRSLLERFSDTQPKFKDVEMADVSVFEHFRVPLEERVGPVKPHRFRKHNRTQRRLRREEERKAERETKLLHSREEESKCAHAQERLRSLEKEREERRIAELRAQEEERALQLAIGLDARVQPQSLQAVAGPSSLSYSPSDYLENDQDLYG
ncbi:hypothetical protein K438DRAFT_1764514 [Mycena galopus ATCC 62051]|nr:hypothetical protein K438DRAFT_1764514 [Mycena galopus ATCC 62051]